MAGLTEAELGEKFRRVQNATVKGDRVKFFNTTYSGKSVSAGSEFTVDVPKIPTRYSIIPGTLNLIYDITMSGTKSHFKNNLSRLLQERLRISVGGSSVYENTHESIYRVYEDLWKSKTTRENMIEYGIANENLRKLISGDDSGTTANKDSDALMNSIFGKRQKMSLNNILSDHGLYPSGHIENHIQFTFATPKSSDILVTQDSQAASEYSMTNLRVEYEAIDNAELAKKASNRYQTTSWGYDHILMDGLQNIPAAKAQVNFEIKKPRLIGKAVVILFKRAAGSDDSEEYVFPDIEKVSVGYASEPNVIYRSGMGKQYFYYEAKRLFHGGMDMPDQFINLRDFFKDKFALVIDLRTLPQPYLHTNGKAIEGTQSGVKVDIEKSTTFGYDTIAYPYLISDGVTDFYAMDIEKVRH